MIIDYRYHVLEDAVLIEPSLEDETPAEEIPQEEHIHQPEKTALTIHIHSWATPIVGFLMLIIGLAGGFFLRPEVTPLLGKATLTPSASEDVNSSVDQPGLKDYVVAQTTHFLGDANAPVTVIEFSDFQ
jgi:hypothetical protein